MSNRSDRRNCIPILYTRGTHYEVGFDVGRTFSGIINRYLDIAESLPDYLAVYSTPEGRRGYDDTLQCLKLNFPQYVRELEGVAEGANVPFHKLFLLHMDDTILSSVHTKKPGEATGCSTICINEKGQEFLGHTEDAYSSLLNNYYMVSAHIITDQPQGKWQIKEERFTSLCYAGHLPGYTMNYNHHGLVFSINTLSAKHLRTGKTPRHFLTRALLGAENLSQAIEILRDVGCGAADGCSINLTFLDQEKERVFYNIEIGPALVGVNESQLDIMSFKAGEKSYHTNIYKHMNVEEVNKSMSSSSIARLEIFQKYPDPKSELNLRTMLGDKTHSKHPVFRDMKDDIVKTICVGIFNLSTRTWSLYSDNPKDNEPLVVLSLQIKQNK